MTKNYEQIRIMISDRSYENWTFQDTETNNDIPSNTFPDIIPSDLKLFTKDILEISSHKITYSPTRNATAIAGVLQLDSGKTFGRTANKKKLLYKCIPNDRYLPIFLVPYEIKAGFSKAHVNKYVIFRFDQWNGKHPQGILCETIGDVDQLDAFYEYQLYSRSIHSSIAEITTNARKALKQKTIQEYVDQISQNPTFQIEDRTRDRVFTIDPPNSADFDDGFSVRYDTVSKNTIVSIYIANVYVWLETLGLWNSFSERVATIYLPEYRRPMLPTILSDALCSLQERETRFAFIMDIPISEEGIIVEDKIRYSNGKVVVKKNYRYEEANLMQDTDYQRLADITQKLDKTASYQSSHDVVAYWMIEMNTQSAKRLAKHKCGIFRSVTFNDNDNINDQNNENETNNIPKEAEQIIKIWKNTTGQYILYNRLTRDEALKHEILEKDTYIHITSPIRRLVDLLNYMYFNTEIMGNRMTKDADNFMSNWISMEKMEYINTSMRSIRKVQTDCELLYKCTKNPEILEEIHKGIVFDRMLRSDGSVTYMVYLYKTKMLSRITLPRHYTGHLLSNNRETNFKMFVFEEENKVEKKIRLQIVKDE